MGDDATSDVYTLSAEQEIRLTRDFTYHAPHDGQPERYVAIREAAKGVARLLYRMTPESREQSLALTHLEEAVFYANAAIARHEDI